MNPVHFGLEMLFKSVGWDMFQVETDLYRFHGFCAEPTKEMRTAGYEGPWKICYFLNKYQFPKRIVFTREFHTKVTIQTLVDTDDHWGNVVTENLKMNKTCTLDYDVPGLSFVTILFGK